jgi:hypothetical protein
MLAAEVHQKQAQPERVPLVAPQPRGGDVIADHAPDVVDAAGQMSQVIAEFGGNDCGEMLVLGNSGATARQEEGASPTRARCRRANELWTPCRAMSRGHVVLSTAFGT